MRNLVIVMPMLLLFVACQPGNQSEETLDLEGAEQQVRAQATKDDKREAMLRVLRLEPGQSTALEQAHDARDEAFTTWLSGEKGQRLIALEAEIKVAVKANDLKGVRGTIAQAKPLRNEVRALVKSHQNKIIQVLSPEQQIQWSGYEVASTMLELMGPLQLAPAQISSIEEGSVEAVAQAINRGEPTPKAAAFLDLERWAEDSVLNAAQYEGYQAIKDAHKMRSLGI